MVKTKIYHIPLQLKIIDNTITIRCLNYRAADMSELVERVIEAGPEQTKMTNTKYKHRITTTGPISLDSEVELAFHAKSGTLN